jgi:hypothetical protein
MILRYIRILLMPVLLSLLASCFYGEREVPGASPNPKLAELLNAALQEQIRMMNPIWAPGLLPQAPDNARLWLSEIDEVVARCRYGPRNNSKHNLLEYDIALRSGAMIEDVFSGQRCLYGFAQPLVMRVRFDQGRVVQALTDGRELKQSIDATKGEINLFAEKVIRTDWHQRRERYFPRSKTSEEIHQEWQTKP